MGFCSFCKKCCCCCIKNKGNSNEGANLNPTLSIQNILNVEIERMNMEDIEEHTSDMRNIYAHAVETMKNFLGKPCYPFITQPKQLYPYILSMCEGLENHEYVSIKEIVSEKKFLNTIQLTVVIKDAKVIHPKVTEFSHIFCKLWISGGQEQLTCAKDNTSHLFWDETFVLDVLDYESATVHMEIWASSTRPGLLERITNFRSESFKEKDPLAEEKDFYLIGDTVEYVKCLPCISRNMLWTLKRGANRKQTSGQLNLHITIGTKRDQDFILHFYCHMRIIKLCYEKEVLVLEGIQTLWKNWLEILPNAALTLIQQHALQHGIAPVEQCLCSWLVASSLKMRQEDRISFYLLRDLLEHLLSNIKEDEIGQIKDILSESVSDFSVFCVDVLGDLHRHFDVPNTKMADELYYMLRCMSTVELKLSISFIDSFEKMEEEASEWYLKIIKDLKRKLEADDSIEEMSGGLNDIMKIYLKNQMLLDDIFRSAWEIIYSTITYKKLDEVVCTTIQPMIKHLMVILENRGSKSAESSLQMLQLYHNVRNLVNYIINQTSSQRAIIRMDDYSSWFGEEMFLEWFILCDIYTSRFIQRAVHQDKMERLGPNSPHGTSVGDVATIIDDMVVEVWMKLKWKDQFYTHGALLEAAKSCVLDYSTYILEIVKHQNFFCQLKEFEVSHKLCVVLSNIYAISEHLRNTSNKIKKELKVAESAMGFEIVEPLINIQSHVQILTSKIFLDVFVRINKRAKNIIKQSLKDKAEFGSVELCSYIVNTLEIMYTSLKREAFYVLLRHMWFLILSSLKNGLKYSKGCFVTKTRKLKIYLAIQQTLNQVKTIFHCDGHGLTEHELDNKKFEELKYELQDKLQN